MRQFTLTRRGALPALVAAAALMLAACSGSGTSSDATSGATASAPAATADGGTLRIGLTGGGADDSIDPHRPVTKPDQARVFALYDTLVAYDPERNMEMALAESVTPNADGSQWTIKLRPGVKFSDGSPITANDVLATFQRITNPDAPGAGAEMLKVVDFDKTTVVDDSTLDVVLTGPDATFVDALAYYANGIVPATFDVKNPVTSGPFMFTSFTPGQESEFAKNPYYWREGEPHVDTLIITNFVDDSARVNALLSGQVDAIDGVPFAQISVIEADSSLAILQSPTGNWLPITMRVDTAPFDDERVRQAMRLIVNRQQMVDQVLSGNGQIGNDLYAPLDPCYNSSLPQREQDIEQAKKLLAEAGQSDLEVELVTSDGAGAGTVQMAEVFAQQAKAAGVTVNVKKVDSSTFWEDYLSYPFAVSFWYTRDFLPQTAAGSMPSSPYNETHWDNEEFKALVAEARRTPDLDARCKLIQQAQEIEWNSGGHIIWGFPDQIDAYNTRVTGLVPDKSGIPLSSFNFRKAQVAQ